MTSQAHQNVNVYRQQIDVINCSLWHSVVW